MESDIKVDKSFSKTNTKFDRYNLPQVFGGSTIELTKDNKYGFGVHTGIHPTAFDIMTKSGTNMGIQTVSPSLGIKVILLDSDITITKIS